MVGMALPNNETSSAKLRFGESQKVSGESEAGRIRQSGMKDESQMCFIFALLEANVRLFVDTATPDRTLEKRARGNCAWRSIPKHGCTRSFIVG